MIKAVILAGGKGRRLAPFTTNFPKPLMPVGNKPILEIIIEKLAKAGIHDIIITTGHLEGLIRVFFQDGNKYGVRINYSLEDEPLGTAGPLNLIKKQLTDTFIVMNGDVLTDLNLNDFINFHKTNKTVATVATARRTVSIDFGVVKVSEDNRFLEWNEKPILPYLVSMGMYLFEPEALKFLPEEGNFFNMPDLIVKIKNENQPVGCYLHNSYWLDIGRPEDYEKACIDFGDKT